MAADQGGPGGDDDDLRPDTDDYDLLTFGEVAARIAEELTEQTAELERVRTSADSDPARILVLEQRIRVLQDGRDRYRQEQRTNAAFARRFVSVQEPSTGSRPR